MNLIKSLSIVMLLGSSIFAFGQVVINEYSASNLNQFADDFLKYEDWIELHNSLDIEVDISGWYLSDKESNPTKWQFPAGTLIPEAGFLRVWCSGREVYPGPPLHTNFKLTQTKGNEVLTLSNSDMVLQESIPMQLTLLGHSQARSEDGAGEWKVCTHPTPASTNTDGIFFKKYTSAPLINIVGGFYNDSLTVGIIGSEPNAVIRYTTDGLHPTFNSPEFTAPINITESTVLKAIAFSNDPEVLPGKIDFQTYFIDESFTLPVLSVAADQLLELANGNRDLRPIGSIEYFGVNGEKEAFSFGELNSHGQDSWVNPHRSLDWVSRDEMGYNSTVKAKLFSYSERDEHQRVMMRASGDDNYPAINDFWHRGSTHVRDEYVHTLVQEGGLKCDVRAVQRMIVFLNGQYWGVYGVRERPVDHDYTDYYYDQGKYDLQYLLTWGGTWAEYGGDQSFIDWAELRNFILFSDMSDSTNYAMVKNQFNVLSLIDYMITNLNAVASDWLNYNTGWWRGLNPNGDHKKWGYIVWDLDATFDYYINYSGVPNTDPDAVPCDIEDISNFMDGFFYTPDVGKHEKIFLKLQEDNEEFRQLYYSRQADLMNTVFSCENMLNTLDRMINVIEPEMPRQIERWGGSMTEWENNVSDLRQFIMDRCQLLDEGMTDCFEVTGPYELTLLTEPDGTGEIDLNTLDIEQFPWTGSYFGGMDNLIKAKAFDTDMEFSHWEVRGNSVLFPDSLSRKASIRIDGPDTLIAHFREIVIPSSTFEENEFNFSLYPTLIKDVINLDFELDEGSTISFELVDLNGRFIQRLNQDGRFFSSGRHQLQISIEPENFGAGMYLLRMRSENALATERIIISQ